MSKEHNLTLLEYRVQNKQLLKRVEEVEGKNKTLADYHFQQKELTQRRVEKLIEQNKHYREFIKTASNPWEIARKIGKESSKKVVTAEEIVGWVERETNKILEGESE